MSAPKRPKVLGLGERRLVSFYVTANFKALAVAVCELRNETFSSYIRRAIWNQLKREAPPAELREYKQAQWKSGTDG